MENAEQLIIFDQEIKDFETCLLTWAIQEAEGVRVNAASILGMSYRSLRHYLQKNGLSKPESPWSLKRKGIRGKAHAILYQAIRDGIAIRGTVCSVCGSTRNVQGHHPDYTRPLEVLWLCCPCHRLEHLKIAQEKRKALHPKSP